MSSAWSDWAPAVVVLVAAVVWIGIVVSIVRAVRRRRDTTSLERTVWTVCAVLFPVGAAAVWLVLGPHPLGLTMDHEQD